MLRALRVVTGLLLTGCLLWLAMRATADCATGAYSSENCLWLDVRKRLHWPASHFLRAGTLEAAGLGLLAALLLTLRYVFPGRSTPRRS